MGDLGPQLAPVGEKTLPAKCKASSLAYCPSMDLIALATDDDELRVYRLNGQRVFGGSFKGDPYLGEDEADGEVRAVVWKGNGKYRWRLWQMRDSMETLYGDCNGSSLQLLLCMTDRGIRASACGRLRRWISSDPQCV